MYLRKSPEADHSAVLPYADIVMRAAMVFFTVFLLKLALWSSRTARAPVIC
jgi:hypothetical protein